MGRGRGISKKPSQYPPLAFHLIRLGQWLSSVIVAIILVFFVHHLHVDHYYIPWTFLLVRVSPPFPLITLNADNAQLLTVSLLTIIALTATTILHFTRTLNPKLNLTANTTLTVIWLLGLILLTWNLGRTLGNRCMIVNWHNEAGVMVCRLYKALTAFTVTGAVATVSALALDIRVQRSSTQLGKYNQMLDVKAPTNVRSSSPFHSGEDEAVPEIHVRGPSQDIQRPYNVQRPMDTQRFGYSAPEEQTSYGGGGGSGDIADL